MTPYPCVIFRARYGGAYEGGKWIALNEHFIPEEAIGDDIECSNFFWGDYQKPIGRGISPDKALKDLAKQVSPEDCIDD